MAHRFRPKVLTFHAVSDNWNHPLAIRVETLEGHVRLLLRRGYRPATAREVLPGTGRLLHVTFDDAYRSIGKALPVLSRLGVPATVFVCTDFIGDGSPGHIPESIAVAPFAPQSELETMTWDNLRAIVNSGVEVGAHTVTHPRLTELADEEVERELRESREKIEAELGRPCPLLAYPYGDEDERIHAAARMAGYDAAFAIPGRVRPLNPYAIPRVSIIRRDGLLRGSLKTSPIVVSAVRKIRPAASH